MKTPFTFGNYFEVLWTGQTYLNLIYLILAFPLGIFYFVFLITGLALGVGLLIIWIGLLILIMVFAGSWVFGQIERLLANGLLDVDIGSPVIQVTEDSLWERVRAYLSNPVTWKSMLFLFMKFPLGIISFVLTVAGASICGALLAAPFAYQEWGYQVGEWYMDSMNEAMLAFVVGIIITPLVLHLLNWIAHFFGQVAIALLGRGPLTPDPEKNGGETGQGADFSPAGSVE